MLDQRLWSAGKRLRVDDVRPPPDDWPSMLYEVVLMPLDEPGTSVPLWCQTATVGASPLHKGDIVTVRGQTPGRVLAELLGWGGADPPRYCFVDADYERDFDAWAQRQAEALRAKQWENLDIEHLAEEVEELRKTERKAVRSQLRRLTSHLLKWAYQPARRSDSWQDTILDARRLVADWLEEDGNLTQELPTLFAWAYPRARREAAKDTHLLLATFPEACPWTVAQVLTEDFWPEA